MEFLPGGDLYSLLQKLGCLNESATKYYILQIVYALQYLHSNGIIHRDLKPDNILVAADGKLKLTDFGLSFIGIVDNQDIQNQSLEKAKSIVGTPDYVAPEIILNETHTVSADYWSLGVILYECLVGEPPFHGQNEQETFDNIISGRYQIDEDLELSKKAIDLINKLLTINPEERLGSKDINDIINHPFFNDVNVDDEPPFKPVLQSEEDTEYFDTRYKFNEKEEADILADISNCKQTNSITSTTAPNTNQSEPNQIKNKAEDNKMINNFESVSIKSLAEETRMAVKRKRSKSFVVYSNYDSISPSHSSSEFISSPSPSPPSSSLTSAFHSATDSNAPSQLSILQPCPPQTSPPPSPPRSSHIKAPSSETSLSNESDSNLNANKNVNVLKPLINTTHADTLVIPFQKQSRNITRRKRGTIGGGSGGSLFAATFGGGSHQSVQPLFDSKKKNQTMRCKLGGTTNPNQTVSTSSKISFPKDHL